jgi:hypothetical protein
LWDVAAGRMGWCDGFMTLGVAPGRSMAGLGLVREGGRPNIAKCGVKQFPTQTHQLWF